VLKRQPATMMTARCAVHKTVYSFQSIKSPII
jgi:hypothetical protein